MLEEPVSSIDEFQAAVLEEQAFDARMQAQIKPLAVAVAAPAPVAVEVQVLAPAPVVEVAPVIVAEAVQVEVVQVEEAVPTVALVEPVAELSTLAAQRTLHHRRPVMVVRHGLPSRSNACCSMWPV